MDLTPVAKKAGGDAEADARRVTAGSQQREQTRLPKTSPLSSPLPSSDSSKNWRYLRDD